MLKLLINRSPYVNTNSPWAPGRIWSRIVVDADLVYDANDLYFEVTVVSGNSQYQNGRKLRLYVDPATM